MRRGGPPFAAAASALQLAGLALALAALGACTGKPPDIGQIDLKPIYVQDPRTGAVDARLRLYLQASDPDGNDDLSVVYLLNDSREMFWELRSGAWQNGGNGWVGTYSFVLPTGWQVPAGTYRVVLEDQAGESVERQVRVDPPPVSDLRFPRAREQAGRVTVDPPNAWIWAYSTGGEMVSASPPASVAWDRVSTYYVYVADAARRVGLLTGPYQR